MNTTFKNIIKKVVQIENNVFSTKYQIDGVDGIYKFFFKLFYDNVNNCYKNKFHFLDEMLTNFYFSKKTNEKNEFLKLFCKIQKIYYCLNNFCYKYKYKKSKLIVNTDLELNNIKFGEPNVISIYHINNRYLFKIQDILKLVYSSLTNSYMFFSEANCIKNPYNNIPFGKSILYYIGDLLENNIKLKSINFKHLDIFIKFKQCEFNMTKFVDCYEHVLREYSIQNYINNSTKETLKKDILQIITQYNNESKTKIYIDKNFPVNELIRIFKPYLYLYLTSKYSLINNIKANSNEILYKKLVEFQKFNPLFGRKICKCKSIITKGKFKRVFDYIEFITEHKKFNIYNNESFLKNHLQYRYESDNIENNSDEEEDENIIVITTYNTQVPNTYNTRVNNYYNQDEDEDEDEDEGQDEDEEQDSIS